MRETSPIRQLKEFAVQMQALGAELATTAERMEEAESEEVRTAAADENRRLLKVGEVSDLLAIPKRSIYMLIQRGEMPAVRFGKTVRVDPDELQAYLESKKVEDTINRGLGLGIMGGRL